MRAQRQQRAAGLNPLSPCANSGHLGLCLLFLTAYRGQFSPLSWSAQRPQRRLRSSHCSAPLLSYLLFRETKRVALNVKDRQSGSEQLRMTTCALLLSSLIFCGELTAGKDTASPARQGSLLCSHSKEFGVFKLRLVALLSSAGFP